MLLLKKAQGRTFTGNLSSGALPSKPSIVVKLLLAQSQITRNFTLISRSELKLNRLWKSRRPIRQSCLCDVDRRRARSSKQLDGKVLYSLVYEFHRICLLSYFIFPGTGQGLVVCALKTVAMWARNEAYIFTFLKTDSWVKSFHVAFDPLLLHLYLRGADEATNYSGHIILAYNWMQ